MSEIKLLPCPFCGRKAELRYNKDGFAYILCANDGCYARTDGCLNENEASRLWNKRRPIERIVERLEKASVSEPLTENGVKVGTIKILPFGIATQIVKEEGGIE